MHRNLHSSGYAAYFLVAVRAMEDAPLTHISTEVEVSLVVGSPNITNGNLTLSFSNTTGLLSSWDDASTGVHQAVTQELRYYRSSAGDWAHNLPAGGAYFMR